ncbi:MAG: hypothetical protein QM703_22650 [Gemmatales bacterium]
MRTIVIDATSNGKWKLLYRPLLSIASLRFTQEHQCECHIQGIHTGHKAHVMKTQRRHGWPGILAASFLLLPVPVFGLTFLGSWNFFESSSGIISKSFSDSPNNYSLTIGMGVAPPPENLTKLSISAVREFQITDPNQLVNISHMFGTLLNNGNISVSISIFKNGTPNDPFNFPAYSFGLQGWQHPSLNYSKSGMLGIGYYRLSITITYTLNQPGNSSWNNSSPHVFQFHGL